MVDHLGALLALKHRQRFWKDTVLISWMALVVDRQIVHTRRGPHIDHRHRAVSVPEQHIRHMSPGPLTVETFHQERLRGDRHNAGV